MRTPVEPTPIPGRPSIGSGRALRVGVSNHACSAASAFGVAGLLLASELGYALLAQLHPANGVAPVAGFLAIMAALFALYFVACVAVSAARDRSRLLVVVVAGAILFRMTLLPAGFGGQGDTIAAIRDDLRGTSVTADRFLLFDNDIWRYVWEGHVWAHGWSPFAVAPASQMLDALTDPAGGLDDGRPIWKDVRDNVSHPDVPAVYPPLAQATFRAAHALAPGSIMAMKSVIVFVDLLAVVVLAYALTSYQRSPALVVLYAWNPLAIKAFAGSGHIDAVVVLLFSALLLAIGRARWAVAISFALAMLAKLTPIVLLPLVARRIGWRPTAVALAIVAAGFAPFALAGGHLFDGLRTFATEWRFNGGPFEAMRWLVASANSDALARAVCGAAVLGVGAVQAWRDDGRRETFAAAAAITLGTLILLSPAVMPWYLTLVLPLALVSGQHLWFAASALVCLAFLVMIDGVQRPIALWVEYGLLTLVALRLRAQRRKIGLRSDQIETGYGPFSSAFLGRALVAAIAIAVPLVPTIARAQGSGSLGAGPGAFTVTQSFTGTVTDVTLEPRTVTVQDKKGKRHQFKVNDATTFTKEDKAKGKTRVAFADVRTGLPVKVTYRTNDELAIDVRLQQPES